MAFVGSNDAVVKGKKNRLIVDVDTTDASYQSGRESTLCARIVEEFSVGGTGARLSLIVGPRV